MAAMTLRERIARAIYTQKHHEYKHAAKWDDLTASWVDPKFRQTYLEHADAVLAEIAAAGMVLAPREPWVPRVGDPIEVVPDFKYGEWVGMPLWVSAVSWDFQLKCHNVTVSDIWPPKSNGDYTDGFYINHPTNFNDIRPRAMLSAAPSGGE